MVEEAFCFRINVIGFSHEDADRIFKIFHDLHGKVDFAETGVELAIAKKAVQNHNRYIRAESKPGEGTAF